MTTDSRGRILVVDDNADIAQSVREILEEEGYQVAVAGDGEEALAIHERQQPSLVLVDMRMPKLHGNELVVRLNEVRSKSTIVALTGSPDVPRGVSAVLQKPFDIEALIAVARRFCRA